MNEYVPGLVSVIVPVYNAEPFLRRCVESILSQTYRQLEVILVDDGSPDDSGVICDQYAQLDARIRVIHQTNQGVSAARNAAFAIARGEYIAFVDADDWIDLSTYQDVVKDIEKYDSDGVFFGINRVDESGNIVLIQSPRLTGIVDSETAVQCMYAMIENPGYGCTACNKMFRRSALQGYHYAHELSVAEDALFFTEVVLNCRRIFLNRTPYYQYYQHEQSAMHKKGLSKQRIDEVRSWKRIVDIVKPYQKLHDKACSEVFNLGISLYVKAYMIGDSVLDELQALISDCWISYFFYRNRRLMSRIKYALLFWLVRMKCPKNLLKLFCLYNN